MFRPRGITTSVFRPRASVTTSRTSIFPAPVLSRVGDTQAILRRPATRVWQSTATPADPADPPTSATASSSAKPTAEQDDGHIDVKSNESILFFDNLFPLKLSSILNRPWKTNHDVADLLQRFETSSLGMMNPIRLVRNAIPEDMPIKVTEINPRLKDGGAFVKFEHAASLDPAEVEKSLTQKLDMKPLKPWFNPFRGIKARRVRGTPWLEDLYRYPTNLLKIEFVSAEPGQSSEELSEETLYSIFRKFGKIADIVPQPQDNKTTPRYAHLTFPLIRDAIMARNCMHGFVVDETLGGGKTGTRLRMSYVKRVKAHSIWNWLTSHPRIVIPIMAALLAGISVIVFDPIREFFVKLHVQHSLNFTESKAYKWFKTQTDSLNLGRKKQHHDGLETVWKHRRDLIAQLQSWLDGSSDTFIVISGPKGSGKKEMVMDQALGDRSNVLLVDCRPIVEARGEAGTIRRLATAVGYRPVFSWANSMSSMVDLAVQSTTGVKAGFSETLESQVTKILQTTSSALKDVALSGRSKKDKDADVSEDAYLESHPEKRPVIVINNFLHKAEGKALIYDKIAEWAASIVQNNVAHVIFMTSDSAFTKPLSKAMPDRVLRELSLGDLDPEVARNFVLSRLEDEDALQNEKAIREAKEKHQESVTPFRRDLTGLQEGIETMGGRLTDLEFLTRRIRTGQTPKDAVEEIVTENATDIVKMYLLGKSGEEEKKWSTQQAWGLIKSLAANPSLRYNQVLLSAPFASSLTPSAKDGEVALDSLASAELISIKFHQGRPQTITASKPLHQAAFGILMKDRVLRAKMDLALLKETAKAEAQDISKYEDELSLLGSLPRQTSETGGRVTYLLKKLEAAQKHITELEKDMAEQKKILNKEY